MPAGPAELAFSRTARVFSAKVLNPMVVVIQGSALLITPPDRLPPAVTTLIVTGTWRIMAVVRLGRGPAPWVLWVDVALLSAVCLFQRLLDVPFLVRDDCGWVFLASEAATVSYQWSFERRPAAIANVLISASYLTGALLMGELSAWYALASAGWVLLAGVVSRWIRDSLGSAARRTDEAGAASEKAQREIDVARALQESELEHLAKLHDTVAATLMMVGLGAAGPRVQEQAGRDLAVLLAPPVAPPAAASRPAPDQGVVERLAAVIRSSELEVTFARSGGGATAPRPVGEALAGALSESLRNIERHAGVGRAHVELESAEQHIVVRIRDGGVGFAEGTVPGRGIQHSITGRMERAGGRAEVTSTPAGVLVELYWPYRNSDVAREPGGVP